MAETEWTSAASVRLAHKGMFQKAHAALVSHGLCRWSAMVHDQLSALHLVGALVGWAVYRTGKHTEAEVEVVYHKLCPDPWGACPA